MVQKQVEKILIHRQYKPTFQVCQKFVDGTEELIVEMLDEREAITLKEELEKNVLQMRSDEKQPD